MQRKHLDSDSIAAYEIPKDFNELIGIAIQSKFGSGLKNNIGAIGCFKKLDNNSASYDV